MPSCLERFSCYKKPVLVLRYVSQFKLDFHAEGTGKVFSVRRDEFSCFEKVFHYFLDLRTYFQENVSQ